MYSQRFDITNNYIHDNMCADQSLVGAGFALNNVSGTIRGNVIREESLRPRRRWLPQRQDSTKTPS